MKLLKLRGKINKNFGLDDECFLVVGEGNKKKISGQTRKKKIK